MPFTPSASPAFHTRDATAPPATAISFPPPSPPSLPPTSTNLSDAAASTSLAAQMFLADKYGSLLPLHPKAHQRRQAGKAPAAAAGRFEAALAARLRELLPLPASPLAALARVADLLALALGEAVPALAGAGDAAAVAAHLDAGVALLDACNAITARLDRLRRRRLLARFALHLLSSPSSIGRARAALADRDDRAAGSPLPPLPSLPFVQPRGRISAAARVLVAVNAISSLAAAAAAAVLGGGALGATFPVVSGDFPWAEAFNAVSSQLSTITAASAGEVDAIDEAVQKLSSVLDGEGSVDEAALRAAAQEVEKRTEELTARLDRLSDAVNGVFSAALSLRNAELGSFMVGPAEKTCK
ncbi:hypothetical protein ACP70R_010741 [Stipagrostis hirtigluma subsp. patula]